MIYQLILINLVNINGILFWVYVCEKLTLIFRIKKIKAKKPEHMNFELNFNPFHLSITGF